MRRLLLLLAAGGLLAGCAALPPDGHSPTAKPSAPPSDTPTAEPTPVPSQAPAARSCTAADMTEPPVIARTNGISQTFSYGVTLRQTGTSPCTPDPIPKLAHTNGQGRKRAIMLLSPQPPKVVVVRPGERMSITVSLSHACDAAEVTYRGLVLSVAGTQVPMTGVSLTGTCEQFQQWGWYIPES